jgi:hypothetical protein
MNNSVNRRPMRRLDEDEDVRPLSERLKRIIEQKRAGTLASVALLRELEGLTQQVVEVVEESQRPVVDSIAKEAAKRVEGMSEESAMAVAKAILGKARELCYENWFDHPKLTLPQHGRGSIRKNSEKGTMRPRAALVLAALFLFRRQS